jgi:uncharacterized protein (TIGR03086 family)
MTELSPAQRYATVADGFDRTVRAVPADAWDRPAPCDGWVARDVVGHLVEWVPAFCTEYASLDLGPMPSVDEDPVAAWSALDAGLRSMLADRAVATREFDSPMGRMTIEDGINTFCTGDVLVHTWDLARATGLDETLDAGEVHALFVSMEPADEALRSSGHFGPKVAVPDDADEQTKLIAFTGRRP